MNFIFGLIGLIASPLLALDVSGLDGQNETNVYGFYEEGTDCRKDIISKDRSNFERIIKEAGAIYRSQNNLEDYHARIKGLAQNLSASASERSHVGLISDMFLRRYSLYPRISQDRVQRVCQRFYEWLQEDPERLYYDTEDFLFSNGAPLLNWSKPKNKQEIIEESAFAKALNQMAKEDPELSDMTFENAVKELAKQVKGHLRGLKFHIIIRTVLLAVNGCR